MQPQNSNTPRAVRTAGDEADNAALASGFNWNATVPVIDQ